MLIVLLNITMLHLYENGMVYKLWVSIWDVYQGLNKVYLHVFDNVNDLYHHYLTYFMSFLT